MNRLWRSRPVALVALLLALALVAAACSSDEGSGEEEETTTTTTEAAEETTTTTEAAEETTTTTEAKVEKAYGGEVIIGDAQYPATLNGFINNNSIVSKLAQMWASSTMIIDGVTLELRPELITEKPTVDNGGVVVNEDGTMTVNYQIRDEAVWDDGTPVSGRDYEFTYQTIMETELSIKSVYEDIVASEAGDKTYSYTLAAPTLQYELIFGELLPEHQLAALDDDFSADWNETRWLSNGPFIFDSLSTGEFIKATRNENYWKVDDETGQQLPYLDSATFRFIGETESLINAFRARELDVINPDPGSEIIETLQSLEPEGATVEVLSGPIWEHLTFQFSDARFERNADSCNENAAMRLAIAQTIDRELVTDEILAGQVEPLDSYVAAYAPTLSKDTWSVYQPDPASANENYLKAVEETGKTCKAVFSTTSNNDARVKLSELFVGMFEASDIPYENSLEDSSLFFGDTFDTGTWDLGEWAWLGTPGLAGLVSIHDVWAPNQEISAAPYRWGAGAEGSYTNANTERFDEIHAALNSTVDENELLPLIEEAESILAEELVFLPLYNRLDVGAVWGDEIGAFKHNPSQESPMWNMEFWHRVDG